MEPELEPENEPQQRQESDDIRALRKKAKRADELEPENNKLRQQLAIAQAGLSELSELQVKALLATHEGEWDGEALKATAVGLGFRQPPEPEVPQEELQAMGRMADAAAGAGAAGKTNPVDEIQSAQSPEEVMAAYQKAGGRMAGEQ